MILGMCEPIFEGKKQVKTTAVADSALASVVARLKRMRVRWKSGVPTQEAVVNASWLWMESLDDNQIEAAMGRFIPMLEDLMRKKPHASNSGEGQSNQHKSSSA